jgi:hypothetical protein
MGNQVDGSAAKFTLNSLSGWKGDPPANSPGRRFRLQYIDYYGLKSATKAATIRFSAGPGNAQTS